MMAEHYTEQYEILDNFIERLLELQRKGYYVRRASLLELRFGVREAKKLVLWYTSDDLDEWDSDEKAYFIEIYD